MLVGKLKLLIVLGDYLLYLEARINILKYKHVYLYLVIPPVILIFRVK